LTSFTPERQKSPGFPVATPSPLASVVAAIALSPSLRDGNRTEISAHVYMSIGSSRSAKRPVSASYQARTFLSAVAAILASSTRTLDKG